jgi:hypothetical protein
VSSPIATNGLRHRSETVLSFMSFFEAAQLADIVRNRFPADSVTLTSAHMTFKWALAVYADCFPVFVIVHYRLLFQPCLGIRSDYFNAAKQLTRLGSHVHCQEIYSNALNATHLSKGVIVAKQAFSARRSACLRSPAKVVPVRTIRVRGPLC